MEAAGWLCTDMDTMIPPKPLPEHSMLLKGALCWWFCDAHWHAGYPNQAMVVAISEVGDPDDPYQQLAGL